MGHKHSKPKAAKGGRGGGVATAPVLSAPIEMPQMVHYTQADMMDARSNAHDLLEDAWIFMSDPTKDAGQKLNANTIATCGNKHTGIKIVCRTGMSVERCEAFTRMTCHDLNTLDSKPNGALLLRRIDETDKAAVPMIVKNDSGSTAPHFSRSGFGTNLHSIWQPDWGTAKIVITPSMTYGIFGESSKTVANVNEGWGSYIGLDPNGTPGTGAISRIDYNPVSFQTPDGNRPGFIGLAHELLHSYHNLTGTSLGEKNPPDEKQVVGVFEFKNTEVSENRIRAEHGIDLRTKYTNQWDGNVPEDQMTVLPPQLELDDETQAVTPYAAADGGCGCGGCGVCGEAGAGAEADEGGHAAGEAAGDGAGLAVDGHDAAALFAAAAEHLL